jgi:hypothetical protein
MSDKIMTLHPEGKQGSNIDKAKYDQMRAAILMVLSEREEMTFADLNAAVEQLLGDSFEGSIGWYFTTVKLDLEARGLLERVGDSPQIIRIPG